MMEVKYVYKDKIIGTGRMTIIPRQGDFIQFQQIDTILKVELIMFVIGPSGDTVAMIRLVDTMSEIEKLIKY